jgi:hypothetical protein
MPSLTEMVGQEIIAFIPIMDRKVLQKVKLLGVETGGIWIESQKMTNVLLGALGVQSAPKSAIFFLPFQQITFVVAGQDVPSLGEKAFGV